MDANRNIFVDEFGDEPPAPKKQKTPEKKEQQPPSGNIFIDQFSVKKKENTSSSGGLLAGVVESASEIPSTSSMMGGKEINPQKYETKLSKEEEVKFKTWLDNNYKEGKIEKGDYDFYQENGYGFGYDFRAAFKAGEKPEINKTDNKWHWSDIGKKPNHPTFSNESKYNNVDGFVGGAWEGEKFIKAGGSGLTKTGKTVDGIPTVTMDAEEAVPTFTATDHQILETESAVGGRKLGDLPNTFGAAKLSVIKPPPISEYIKDFEDRTGAGTFNLGSDLPQIKETRDQKKYLQYRKLDEQLGESLRSISNGEGDLKDFNTIKREAPRLFENVKNKLGIQPDPSETDEDNKVWDIFNQYKGKVFDERLQLGRQRRASLVSEIETALPSASNFTGKEYTIPKSSGEAKQILQDIDNKKGEIIFAINNSDTFYISDKIKQIEQAQKEIAAGEAARPALIKMVSGMVFDEQSKLNPNLEPFELGKKIYEAVDPKGYALYKAAGGDEIYGDYISGFDDTPKKADAINRYITNLGIDAFNTFGNKAAIEKADRAAKSLGWQYTRPLQEETRHMIAAELHRQGIKPHKATGAEKDAIAETLPEINRNIWFEKNKEENNTSLPSTGFGWSVSGTYHNTIEDATKGLLGWMMPNRGRERALDVLEQQTASNVVGENPESVARLAAIRKKERGMGLTDEEKAEKKTLEKFTDVRTDWQKFKDLSGTGVGQFVGFGTIASFTGGLGNARTPIQAVKSLISPMAGRKGMLAAGYLMSREQNARDAVQMFPGEDEGITRFVYGETASYIDTFVERLFPEERFLSGIFKKEAKSLIPSLTAKNLRSELNENLASKIAKNIVSKVAKQQATPIQEGIEEMLAAKIKDTFHGILDPSAEAMTMNDIINTGTQAYLSSQLLGVPKGLMATRNPTVPLNAIWDVASDKKTFFDVKATILEMKGSGDLTNNEANERISLLNTAQKFYQDNPVLSGNMGALPIEKRQNYLGRLMNEAVLQKKADETTDEVAKSQYNKEIAESKKARKAIFEGDVEVNARNRESEVPSEIKKANDQWKEKIANAKTEAEKDVIMEKHADWLSEQMKKENVELSEEQKIIQSAIDKGEIKDDLYKGMAQAALTDPEAAKQLIADIKSQSTGEVAGEIGKAESGQRNSFGDSIVDFAIGKTSETEFSQKAEQVGQEIAPILQRMNDADYINENELSATADKLYDILDEVEKSKLTDDQKESSRNLIEPLIQKLEGYEFTTTTTTGTVTEKVPTGRTTKVKIEIKPPLSRAVGSRVTVKSKTGSESTGVLKIENGNYYVYDGEGNKVSALGNTTAVDSGITFPEGIENPIEFDENGNVNAVSFETKDGSTVRIEKPDTALDIAIQLQSEALGEIPDEAFQEVYKEVEKQVPVEVLKKQPNETAPIKKTPEDTKPKLTEEAAQPEAGANETSEGTIQSQEKSGSAKESSGLDTETKVADTSTKSGEGTGEPPKPPTDEGSGGLPPTKKVEGTVDDDGNKLSGIKKALVSNSIIEGVDLNKIGDKEMMALGRKIIDSGEVKPEALVEKIITEKQGVLTPAEVVAMITYKADIDNALRDAYKKANEKQAAGDDLGTLNVEIKNLERQVDDFDVAAVITAQQQSMAFRLRKMMLDRDYNLTTQIEKYKKNNNGTIPADVEARFRELDKELKGVKALLAEAEKKATQKEEQDAVDNIKEDVERNGSFLTDEEIAAKVQEGIQSEIEAIHQKLPAEKKRASDKAIAALERFQKKLRGKAYSDVGGFVAIVDAGITTIKNAIKAGVAIADAVELGINKIKKAFGQKWDKEDEFRKDMIEGFEAEGIATKKNPKDTPTINEDGTVSIPNNMLRDLVARGITDIEGLTDAVHEKLVKQLPDITKRQVRDYITEYGKMVNPTADDLQKQVNTAKRVGRLISELEDLENKKKRTTNPSDKQKITDKEKELSRQIKSLSESIPLTDQENETAVKNTKERVRQRIKELETRIKNKDFSKKKKLEPVKDAELVKLNAEKDKIQEEFDNAQYKNDLKNRTFWQKAEDIAKELVSAVPRALVASLDFSASFVQGVWRFFSQPIKSFKAMGDMFRQFWSEKSQQEWMDKLKSKPFYPLMQASKLAISDKKGKASVKEGLFISNWINLIYDGMAKIITLGYRPLTNLVKRINPYKASQRAFDGYVNSIRVQSFISLAKQLEKQGYTFEADPKVFEKAADFVNTTTATGGIGALEKSSSWLNILLFAPRKVVSEIKLFTPYAFVYYAKMPPAVRKKALLNFATFITNFVATNALMWAARKDWDDDDEDDNFWNMNSSDFMTHKFGDQRVSFGGGAKTTLVFLSRLMSGKFTDQYGKTTDLGDRYGKQINTRLDLMYRFALGKASPGISVGAKKLDEKKGLEIDDAAIVKDIVTPIWMQDAASLYKDNPAAIGGLFTILSIFGANVRTVDEQKGIKTFKIYQKNGNKVREATPEEDKKYKAETIKLYDAELKKAEKNQGWGYNNYGELTISDDDIKKKGSFKDLTEDDKKELQKRLKSSAAAKAKEKITY